MVLSFVSNDLGNAVAKGAEMLSMTTKAVLSGGNLAVGCRNSTSRWGRLYTLKQMRSSKSSSVVRAVGGEDGGSCPAGMLYDSKMSRNRGAGNGAPVSIQTTRSPA